MRVGCRHVQDKEFEVSWMFDRIHGLPEDMQPAEWSNLLTEPVRCEANVSIRISEACRHDECAGDKSLEKVV